MELQVLKTAATSIRDELLLWALAMATLALVAGLRDRVTFIVVLVVGATLFALRLFLAARKQQPPPRRLPLALDFKGHDSAEVDLTTCRYELTDLQTNERSEGVLEIALERNGWVCFLPPDMTDHHLLRVFLTDGDGSAWRTRPFRPLFNRVEVIQA